MMIGLSGKMGSGKDYIATYCAELLSPVAIKLAFADQLKYHVISEYSLSSQEVFATKNEKIRSLIQQEADIMKHNHGDDVWIQKLHNIVAQYREGGYHNFVITDVRYPNEIDYICRHGGTVIRIESDRTRDNCANSKFHTSETALDDYDFKYVIDNSSDKSIDEICKNLSCILSEL